jgi:hypothetical protein
MYHKPVSGLAGIALLLACAAVARSQDFHVSTRIYDLSAAPQEGKKEQRRPPAQHCESLFHAGKVYDYNDGGSQVTIFEPAQERFVIIDSANRTSTEVSFDYINNRLHQARARRAEELPKLPEGRAAFLDFELYPKFQEKFDKERQTLVLDSPFVSYQVRCEPAPSPELLQVYLDYADWAARLNYVSYRTPSLPDARLAVNERLRQKGMLPVNVVLKVKLENGTHMRAEHLFNWKLDDDNRTAISHWDKMPTARDVKRVAPDEFFEKPIKQATNRRK